MSRSPKQGKITMKYKTYNNNRYLASESVNDFSESTVTISFFLQLNLENICFKHVTEYNFINWSFYLIKAVQIYRQAGIKRSNINQVCLFSNKLFYILIKIKEIKKEDIQGICKKNHCKQWYYFQPWIDTVSQVTWTVHFGDGTKT